MERKGLGKKATGTRLIFYLFTASSHMEKGRFHSRDQQLCKFLGTKEKSAIRMFWYTNMAAVLGIAIWPL